MVARAVWSARARGLTVVGCLDDRVLAGGRT
jgi:hypothetical protein